MHPRVRLVVELARQEPPVLFRELLSLDHHTRTLVSGIREDHLRAEEAHQLTALNRERLRHHTYKWVALCCAHHGQTDACVAARRFNDGLTRLELTSLLRPLDHTQCQPVFDTSHRIEGLALDIDLDIGRRQAIRKLDNGRAANRGQDILVHRRDGRVGRDGRANRTSQQQRCREASQAAHCNHRVQHTHTHERFSHKSHTPASRKKGV